MFKTIVVKEATDKGKNIKIVDQDKLKFTLWKTDSRNGQPNAAFTAYQGTQGVGATLDIEYAEKPASFTGDDGKLVEYTDRTIRAIKTGTGQFPAQPQNTSPRANTAYTEAPKDRNWDREAYEKCCSIWAQGELANAEPIGKIIENIEIDNKYWKLFQAIRKDGEKRFATGWDKAKATFAPELPIIHADEVDGDQIPFGDDEAQ